MSRHRRSLAHTISVVIAAFGCALICSPKASNGFCFLKTSKAASRTRGAKGVVAQTVDNNNDKCLPSSIWNMQGACQTAITRGSSGVTLVAALFVLFGSTTIAPVQAAVTEAAEIRGIKLSPLNSLTFNYRGADFAGLDATTISSDQPTISYKDFLDRLSLGEVEYVEFLAPNGDEAYVTLKVKEGEKVPPVPIRIGEGYPIEKSDGWSSPAFAIRSVKDKGVPFKFVVPGLDKYK